MDAAHHPTTQAVKHKLDGSVVSSEDIEERGVNSAWLDGEKDSIRVRQCALAQFE